MEKFTNWLVTVSTKFAQNKTLNIIQRAFMMLLPITFIGSFASLFKGLPVPAYQAWIVTTPLYNALGAVYQWTVGMLAVYIVFLIAYAFCEIYQLHAKNVSVGITALAGFLIVTPFTEAVERGDVTSLPVTWLGSSGMFLAIILGFVTGCVFLFCEKKHIELKLADSVPPMVASQFTALIPAIFTVILCIVINIVFGLLPVGNVQQAVYSLLAMPLTKVSSNIFGLYILTVVLYLLWFFGIHGGMTVGPIMILLFTQLGMENLAAYQAGQALPHLFTGKSLVYGNGSLPLLIAMLLVSKSKANRSITKLALIPSFFGVDEPAYFGIPVIYNPVFFIPFVLVAPAVSVFGTYILEILHLIPYYSGVRGSGFEPFFIGNLLAYGVRGMIWGCILFALIVLAYIPFVRAFDRQKLKEEQETEENR